MKRMMAAAFFVMLMGALSCSSDPCSSGSGCSMSGGSSNTNSLCNNNSSGTCSASSNQCTSSCCNCKSGYHQVGSGSNAYCAKNQ